MATLLPLLDSLLWRSLERSVNPLDAATARASGRPVAAAPSARAASAVFILARAAHDIGTVAAPGAAGGCAAAGGGFVDAPPPPPPPLALLLLLLLLASDDVGTTVAALPPPLAASAAPPPPTTETPRVGLESRAADVSWRAAAVSAVPSVGKSDGGAYFGADAAPEEGLSSTPPRH